MTAEVINSDINHRMDQLEADKKEKIELYGLPLGEALHEAIEAEKRRRRIPTAQLYRLEALRTREEFFGQVATTAHIGDVERWGKAIDASMEYAEFLSSLGTRSLPPNRR